MLKRCTHGVTHKRKKRLAVDMSNLWSMFFFSVLLVAALNWYALEREPDVVNIEDLVEHNNEVVRIEGKIISWVEDPYGQGDQRMDIIVEDSTHVVEVRWYQYGALPPIGSNVSVTGDVITYNGRIWIQALGSGSVQVLDFAVAGDLSLTELSADPASYLGDTVRIEGYLSKTLMPDSTWSSIYLADHPNYANTKHQIKVYVSSATGYWIEAGSKVTLVGEIHYEERDLRYVMYTQGPEIMVDYSVKPQLNDLDWDDMSSWVYEENKIVRIDGTPQDDAEGLWWIVDDDPEKVACISPDDELASTMANYSAMNESATWSGRLVWSGLRHTWCIDAGGSESIISGTAIQDLFEKITSSPIDYLNDSESRYDIYAYMAYSLEPGSASDESYLADGATYQSTNFKVKTIFQSARDEWLEAGQMLKVNVSVGWDAEDARMILTAYHWNDSYPKPEPETLSWNNGPLIWGYSVNKMVHIEGVLNTTAWSDVNETSPVYWLEWAGSDEKICLRPADTNSTFHNYSHGPNNSLSEPWTGRLIEIEDRETRSMILCLDYAATEDSDGDGLSDRGENEIWMTDVNSSDSDGDGVSDFDEVVAATDPLDDASN